MRRVTSIELLDTGLLASHDVHANLDDLWRVNRYLGGLSSSLRLLGRYFERTGQRRIRVLEAGAGDGRLAAGLRRELARRGIEAEFVLLDLRLEHLKRPGPAPAGLHPVAADALAPPFAERSFDLATCNLFFHHFSGARALRLLAALASVARAAVLVNDLERHWLPYLVARLAPWIWRNWVSRHDGLASLRQAYTLPELTRLATLAGFRDFEAYRMLLFRLGLVLWKVPALAPA